MIFHNPDESKYDRAAKLLGFQTPCTEEVKKFIAPMIERIEHRAEEALIEECRFRMCKAERNRAYQILYGLV